MADRRRFTATVLGGLVGTGLCALAGTKPWAAPDGRPGSVLVDDTGGHVPLAGALGLVGLAVWGVLLVTRGRVRRAVAVLGAVAGAALLVTAVLGRSQALDSARHATVDLGRTPSGAHVTGWWWVALAAALLALVTAAAAVRFCPAWPEMGRRYDAPAGPGRAAESEGRARPGPAGEPAEPEVMEGIDLWRAIDQGRDPTDPGSH